MPNRASSLSAPANLQDELADAAEKLEIFDGSVLLEVQLEDLVELEVHPQVAGIVVAQMELLLRYDSGVAEEDEGV